jgi:outer membrane protein assembly factor BamB
MTYLIAVTRPVVRSRAARASALVAAALLVAAGVAVTPAARAADPAAPAGNIPDAKAAAEKSAALAASANQTDFDKKAATPVSGDLPMWGGTPHRNMVSAEKNAPTEWDVEGKTNIKWVAKLGSKAYGNPIVTNGMVLVGTNNEAAYDKKYTNPDGTAIDGGVLMAFDEKTGKFLWQKYFAKLPSGRVNDWPGEGLCSTVYSEKDRIWFCSNRCEVVCLDVSASEPREVWKTDMMKTLGVFPHNMTAAAPVAYGDYIYVTTGNGVDDTHKNVVAPKAPGLVCFDKNTGKMVWQSNIAGDQVLHGQWASVSVTEVKRPDGKVQPLVIAPLGDGWVYAYDAKTGEVVWKFDSNPKDAIYPQTRNELIATPVIYENKMYIANGQDPEHGTGYAHFWCVDITKTGDVSPELPPAGGQGKAPGAPGTELVQPAGQVASRRGTPNPNSAVVWHFFSEDENKDGKIQETERFHRSISSAAISNGLCYVSDFSGYLHCFDANTGKKYWTHDLEADVWGSPLVVDGKVYLGDGDGDVHIMAEGKEKKEVGVQKMPAAVYGSVVMANGTMYVLSMHELVAIQKK